MEFATPTAFLLLLFIPFVAEDELLRRIAAKLFPSLKLKAEHGIRFASPVPIGNLPRSAYVKLRPYVLTLLRVLCFTCLVIALARPRSGTSYTEVDTSGRDIMFVLDLSGSMQALDFTVNGERVNRLTALKSVVKEFIQRRSGDRMGLVVFGTESFTQCPLTNDQRTIIDFVDALEIGMAGEATAIGKALAIATKRTKDIEAESKVIILVTDGQNNSGSVHPLEAARIAAKERVRIHTVGIGGKKPAPFPVVDWFGRTRLNYQELPMDEETLKEIARLTGGKYFNAQDTEELENIYNEIDLLEPRKETATEFVDYEEHFLPLLAAGLVFLFLYELIGATLMLRIP